MYQVIFFCPKLEFELDENNNEEQNEDANKKNTCMKLKCQTDEKGKPYNDQIRQVYYMFLSRRIGLQHIKPIIEGVLSLVDVQIEKLPSVATASEMVTCFFLTVTHFNTSRIPAVYV
jgi:hypothetical protein